MLVNEHTASASEILAGAIKDNCRGVLVGKKTYGKVSLAQSAMRHSGLCPQALHGLAPSAWASPYPRELGLRPSHTTRLVPFGIGVSPEERVDA